MRQRTAAADRPVSTRNSHAACDRDSCRADPADPAARANPGPDGPTSRSDAGR